LVSLRTNLSLDGPSVDALHSSTAFGLQSRERVFGNVILGRLLDGPPDPVRAIPTWLGMTPFGKYALSGRPPSFAFFITQPDQQSDIWSSSPLDGRD
jgi:hypothetical protein